MPHTPINQLNIPAIFAAAQGIKRSQLEIDQFQREREREGRITDLTAGAVRGDPSSRLSLAGLDPSKAGAATDFFRENVLPGVLSRARSVLEAAPEAFAEQYGTFVDDLTRSDLLDKNDPPPPDPDRAFIERVITDGVALQNQEPGADFTLGPGQRRLDAEGNIIASVPAKPETSPEIIRLQNALDATDDPKRKAQILRRIDKLGEPQPGKTKFDVAPSPNRQDEIRGNIQSMARARATVAKLRESIVENRSRAGVVGTISRVFQEGVGIVRDFVDIGIDVPGFLDEMIPQVAEDIQNGAADQGISAFFDPSIPENDVFENSLAYALARARKGSGRLNRDDVLNARKDTKITGLTSSDAVLAKLQAIDQELAAAQNDFQNRLGGITGDKVPTFEVRDGRLIKVE